MKLIIYWLTMLVILPLGYLFLAKKTWRLLLGVIILIVLIVGWILPGKLAFSILKKELKKIEEKMDKDGWSETGKEYERRSWQKIEEALKNTLQQEITPENREKITLEKEIIEWRKEIKKAKKQEEEIKKEKEKYSNDFSSEAIKAEENIRKKLKEEVLPRMAKGYEISRKKEWEWARKWGGKEDPPSFLFCGEEFNYELTKERIAFKGSWKIVEDWDYHSDVINFKKYGNAKPDFIKKRIRESWDYWNGGITRGRFVDDYPIILFKNVDKITNSELQKELLLIFDPKKNDRYDKYQIKDWNGKPTGEEGNIDLSRFVLVATASTSNPQLSKELRSKLKHIESFFDKYRWFIFFSSLGIEIIIFRLLVRSKRKINH